MSTNEIDVRQLDLRIVPATSVTLHELTDPERVARLEQSLRDDNVIRNPPVVAEVLRDGEARYVVLDGATRTTALRNLGCVDLLVQVVPYEDGGVALEAWYHLLPHHVMDSVLQAAKSFLGASVETITLEEAREALTSRTAAAAIVLSESVVHVITNTDDASNSRSIIRSLVHHYGGFGEIYRIVNKDLLRTIRGEEDVPAVVMFPTWHPHEVVTAALEGSELPAGITRHVIPGRALNINLSLDVLSFEAPCADKNEWLATWLTSKVMSKKVRYYHEPVFVFDD